MSSSTSSRPSGTNEAADAATNIIGHVQTLVRQEVALLKAQVADAAAHSGKAAGLGGATAVLGLYILGFLGLAGGAALIELTVLAPYWCWLIVAGFFALIAVITLSMARSEANKGKQAPGVATTKIKEDVAWARQQIKP